jgi:hypothetical protein
MRKDIIKLPIQGLQKVHCGILGAFFIQIQKRFLTGTFSVWSYFLEGRGK